MPDPLPVSMPSAFSDIIPDRHLPRLSGLTSPRIVIVGDSISTRAPHLSHDMIDTFWGYFQRAFLLANPGIKPDFVNRAMGGANFARFAKWTLDEARGSKLNLPWVVDPSQRWLDHVEALEPDLLIQAFGMNDAGSFDTVNFQKLQSQIDGWTKQPDRIYVPTMLPSRTSDRDVLSSDQGQAGRLYAAHYVRSWAVYHGYGIIDLNRAQCQSVQGFDPRVSHMEMLQAQRIALPCKMRTSCQDFGFVIKGPDIQADLSAGLDVQIGAGSTVASGQAMLRLTLDQDKGITLAFFDAGPDADPYLVHRCQTPIAQAPERLSLFVKDVFAHIELDGDSLYFGRIRRHGGAFHARVSRNDGAKSTSWVQQYHGAFRQHQPVLSDLEAYGAKQPEHAITGGNFRNHPSSLLASHVFAPVLEAAQLTIPRPAPAT